MTDTVRKEFEARFRPPHDVVYNEKTDEYCWKQRPNVTHLFNGMWEAWQEAIGYMNSRRQQEKEE